ncbi:MAG TPA: hypothetical protein VL307_01910 [Chitinophagaceae bacterium]|nr:hypothetical protein [Chitinophagaceae bacterium]
MPVKKKKVARKAIHPAPKKAVAKKAPVKKSAAAGKASASPATAKRPLPLPLKKKHTLYIESAAFFPPNSADGYVDLFQDGRRTAVAGRSLSTAIVLPVGAVLKSISIHYTNTTPNPVLSFFLRKHADRHSPSGEIEMSFINLPPAVLPPDNYLTVTDTTFPDGGVIQDRFLHYLEIPGTGDFGAGGRFTVRGASVVFLY